MPFPLSTRFPGEDTFPGPANGGAFIPPFITRHHIISGALRGSLQYGLAVMRINGEWVESEFPSWEQTQAADLFFAGGSEHEVDGDVAAALIEAGYTITETD